jgi:serine/threonine protein kinase
MPSDSVADFLDRAKASRVLFPEQVEQLYRQPDLPQSDLASLCSYLLSRGVLTQFQAEALREGRTADLTFAGYPVINRIGPCPGGVAYQALHPSLRTPLILRRIPLNWLLPDDTPAAFIDRARSIGMLPHPNLVHLLDAGVYRDELYLVIEHPTDSVQLDELTHEIGGAMPGFLAAEYACAVASALRLAHERGGIHGDVRPAHLWVGPIVTKPGEDGTQRRRPAPHAVVRLAELGLLPLRRQPIVENQQPVALAYLAPERLAGAEADFRTDIYGLGATLYFLLAGRPPFVGTDTTEILNCIRFMDPNPLAVLRPDLPPEFTQLITGMMHKLPEKRPVTMADVEQGLLAFCRSNPTPAEAIPEAQPSSSSSSIVASALPVAESLDEWGSGSATFAMTGMEQRPRPRTVSQQERGRSRMLLLLGGILHLTAIALLIAWAMGAFEPAPEPVPDTKPTRKEPFPSKKKPVTPND